MDKMTVALAQVAVPFLQREAGVRLAVEQVAEAGRQGVQLLAFPETWLGGGYPVWIDAAPGAALWGSPAAKALHARLQRSAVTADGPELTALHAAARHHGMHVVMGLHERHGGTLYNTMAFLHSDGTTRRLRRKLVPTYTERMVWGRGDGSTLQALPTPHGVVGGLICWEHWMPFARAVMHEQDERVHVAQWPTVHELHQLASRQYAFEGGCFVLASGGMLTRGQALAGYREGGVDAGLELLEQLPGDDDHLLLAGGSAIIAPDTQYVAGPLDGEEGLLVAEIDLAACDEARLVLDAAGHYSRPDIFTLQVDTRPRGNVAWGPGEPG